MTDELRRKAIEVTREAYDTAIKFNHFPEKKHKALAAKYPEGEKAYYNKEITTLLDEAFNKSMVASAWINSNMPIITADQIAVHILEMLLQWEEKRYKTNVKYIPNYTGETDEDRLKDVKDEAEAFFRIYYNYTKLKEMTKQANTKMAYSLHHTTIADIYEKCYPDVIDCNFLTFCNAVYNPDTFSNAGGTKSNLMLFLNVMSKFRSLGSAWRKDACASKEWDVKECSKRSAKDECGNTPEWYEMIKKLTESR